MPRMSIDDKFRRDPRVLVLARLCGWNRRETMGALIDVWAVCYDRAEDFLAEAEIDAAAELDGFAAHMITVGLARTIKRGLRITGAKKRIEYLKAARESGRKGGLKSGESRRNSSKPPLKGRLPNPSGKTNPSATAPDLPSASATSLEPEREREAEPSPSVLPTAWEPEASADLGEAESHARTKGIDVAFELKKFRAWARAEAIERASWDAAWIKWLLSSWPPTQREREAKAAAVLEASSRRHREVERKPAIAVQIPIADLVKPGAAAAAHEHAMKILKAGDDPSAQRVAHLELK